MRPQINLQHEGKRTESSIRTEVVTQSIDITGLAGVGSIIWDDLAINASALHTSTQTAVKYVADHAIM